MIGRLDEADLRRWQSGDTAVLRAEFDRALTTGPDSAVPDPSLTPPSDAELVEAVRGGTVQAYGLLYARHVHAARNLARQLARSPVEADDLVSDAFAKVLSVLCAGGGPDSAFRAYLLTAVRHTAYDKFRRDRKVDLTDDVEAVPGVATSISQPFHDTAVARLDRSLAAKAFSSLPERWQTVLWHTAIEGQTPAQVAPLLGLTPNGVSALAHRAREGLRNAYLQAHVARHPSERCRATATKLGDWTRGGLSKRETTQVEAHLDKCADCQALTAELADVNDTLRGIVAPLVLGLGATGYLAAGAGKASAAVSVGASAGVSAAQWLGVAGSAVLLAIAVGAGVRSPDTPIDPTAVAEPPAASTTSRSTTPSGQATSSAATASSTSEPTGSTGEPNEPNEPSTVTPSSTTAAAPALTSTAPAGFTTSTGGPPTDFPITIRNSGSAPAPPTTMVLSLPDDIKVVGPGNNLRGGVLVGLDGTTQTVGCPAGKDTVTCTARQELGPGDSVTFVFRLLAGPKAKDGTITATTDSGPPLLIEIPITIKPKK